MDDKVAVMNLEQIGTYIKLMCFCWNNDGLPSDKEELKNMCGNPGSWEVIWRKVGKCFYENNGKLYNKRLEKERMKQQAWREKSKLGGEKSAESRRKLKGGSTTVATKIKPKGKPPSSSSSSSPITSSIPKEDTEILTLLSKAKTYPFNKDKDLEFINGLKTEFPNVDILEKVKQITLNWLKFPLNKKSRPRVQIRRWITNEKKWQQEGDKGKRVGQSYEKEPSLIPMKIMTEAYKLLDRKKWESNSAFYDRAKSAFPIIRTQWDLSDKKPETFIRMVEGVQ